MTPEIKNTLRIVAHFVFGASVGSILSNIGSTWPVLDYCLFVIGAGALVSFAAEFFQAYHYTNVRPYEPDSFQAWDVVKNGFGVLIGAVLNTLLGDIEYYIASAILGVIMTYAVVQVVRRRPI